MWDYRLDPTGSEQDQKISCLKHEKTLGIPQTQAIYWLAEYLKVYKRKYFATKWALVKD